MHAFASWRTTAPLTNVGGTTRWFVRGCLAWISCKPGTRPRRFVRLCSVTVVRYFLARPRLARPTRRLLRRFPAVERPLRKILVSPADTPSARLQNFTQHGVNVDGPSELSRRSRSV